MQTPRSNFRTKVPRLRTQARFWPKGCSYKGIQPHLCNGITMNLRRFLLPLTVLLFAFAGCSDRKTDRARARVARAQQRPSAAHVSPGKYNRRGYKAKRAQRSRYGKRAQRSAYGGKSRRAKRSRRFNKRRRYGKSRRNRYAKRSKRSKRRYGKRRSYRNKRSKRRNKRTRSRRKNRSRVAGRNWRRYY